jgi:AraC-like DNA-binding protein
MQVPTVATSVVFRTTVDGRSDLLVVGPRTRGRYHAPKDLPVCVRIALPAGAAWRLFRMPVRELVDRAVPLVELWGPPAVELTASLVVSSKGRPSVESSLPAAATRPIVASAHAAASFPAPSSSTVASPAEQTDPTGQHPQPVEDVVEPGPAPFPAVSSPAVSSPAVSSPAAPFPAAPVRTAPFPAAFLPTAFVPTASLPTASSPAASSAATPSPAASSPVGGRPSVAAYPSLAESRSVASAMAAAFTTGPEPGLLRTAMRELAEPSARLSAVAERVGVGERYLRGLFAREIGLSPKQFARVSRVRAVLAMAGQRRWAAVAEEAGFFDQAHMIGDFREVMGVPPAAFLAGKRPAATPCGSLSVSFE